MNTRRPVIGILFNAFEPAPGRSREAASERAVEAAAREAAEALSGGPYAVRLIPLRRRIEPVLARIGRLRPAAIVNLCEGFRGRSSGEARMAALLELLGLPFTGNPAAALLQCQDKYRTARLLRACGLPTPRGCLMQAAGTRPAGLAFPLIVKPNREDASLGIYARSVVRTDAALREQVARVTAAYAQPALVEEYVAGREFNVGIADLPAPRVLPVSEIVFRGFPRGQPRIVTYDAKWRPGHPDYRATVPVCPARIPAALAARLGRLAGRAWRVLGLRGYARADFRLDARGRVVLLEINPNPDTSRDAGLARMLAAAGLDVKTFWTRQVEQALAPRRPDKGTP